MVEKSLPPPAPLLDFWFARYSTPNQELPLDILSADDVRHVARLTHLSLTDYEVEKLRAELSSCLTFFQTLQEVDTTGVEPTGHSTDARSVMREDEPRDSLPRSEVLANAPHSEDDYVRVLPVFG
ncbi:MAG: Asp-tRNA(Asn)/Glu-tRNA(Gln) amidotransferase subunit GatC [Chloroflexi bacterium]|nr:Asp-tRNA(Asn)/Glu-tRNA(Gln) amidotransferase subunit GatC [Chloroflexota bacterium]